MALLTLKLHSLESAIDAVVKADVGITERVFHLAEPQELSYELTRVGSSITITLVKAPQGAEKYRGVPQNTGPDFPMRPESEHVGISLVSKEGIEFYLGRASHPNPR